MPKTYSENQLHSMNKGELIGVIEAYQRQNIKRRDSLKATIADKQQKGERLGRPRKEKPENFDEIMAQVTEKKVDIETAAMMCNVSSRTFRRWLKEGDVDEN